MAKTKTGIQPASFVAPEILEECPEFMGGITLKDETRLDYCYTNSFVRKFKAMRRSPDPKALGRDEEKLTLAELDDEDLGMIFLHCVTHESRQQHEKLKDITPAELFDMTSLGDLNRIVNEGLWVVFNIRPKRTLLKSVGLDAQ